MQTGRQARPTLTLDKVPFQCPYMLFHATSNYKQGLGAQPFALHQNIKHCLLPKQKHFISLWCFQYMTYFCVCMCVNVGIYNLFVVSCACIAAMCMCRTPIFCMRNGVKLNKLPSFHSMRVGLMCIHVCICSA